MLADLLRCLRPGLVFDDRAYAGLLLVADTLMALRLHSPLESDKEK